MARNIRHSSPQPHQWMKGKVIGSGSHGNVHLAINKASGELFVAKSAQSGGALQSLENEANILGSLNSPYVVRYFGRDLSKGSNNGESKLHVFMEYMAGGSLADVADQFGGALDEEVIRLYTRQILYGLKYLHENGIVHCDLKSKNVLVGLSGNIKLGDFGCAKRVKDLKNDGKTTFTWQSIGGTPLWMAPEVLRNERLDFASDIWSLGCTVIEMATGRPPWSSKVSNPMAAVLKIACSNENPEFPIHFSEEGLDFLSKCLERSPAKRWTAEELLDHPFISGNLQQNYACSPASVFDIGIFYSTYDSDETESPNDDGYFLMDPFSTQHSCEKTMVRRQQAEIDFRSSEDWITVR